MNNTQTQWQVIGVLGVTQIASWGSLFYAFALLSTEIQRELGWRPELVFGAFSWGLLITGLSSTPAGILIDRFGGRFVMATGSLFCGLGMVLLSFVHMPGHYYAVWTLLGVGMAFVLYEAAFATINRVFLENARRGISTLTLIAGFASTVFWPLTLRLNAAIGWRDTYLVFGLLQLTLCMPLHLLLPARAKGSAPMDKSISVSIRNYSLKEVLRERSFWLLAIAFAANSFVFSALAVHLIPILHKLGHPMAMVVFFAAFIGPMQVAGRIGEMFFARHIAPIKVGQVTVAILPTALITLVLMGQHQGAVAVFCLLYGLSNGIMTIVRGTVPRALFGHEHYGAIAGALAGPTLISQATGPLVVAGLLGASLPPDMVLTVLIVVSLVSMGFYFAALRSTAKRAHRALSRLDTAGD